jgi:uncharacterized membrane protein
MAVSRARTDDRRSAVPSEDPAPPATMDRRLHVAVIVLSVIGLGIAAYLTYVHYTGLKVACTNTGCETVQSSVYAKVSGVPVPVLGLVGYAAILGSAVLLRGDLGRVAGFGLALVGFLFSAYLTYRELFTIHAICEWCVSSAVVMTVLLILTGIRTVRGEPEPR